ILNARIRKRFRAGGLKVGVVGPRHDLTYDYEHLGAGPQTLKEIAAGGHAFAQLLKDAKNPLVIVGQGALARKDGTAVLANAIRIARAAGAVREDWNGFGVLHMAAARAGGLDLGLVPGAGGRDVEAILDGA